MLNFIRRHHVLSLSTSDESGLWASSCFYVFDEENLQFIIITDLDTRHGKQALKNSSVAGTVALETKSVGKIQGIQFSGKIILLEGKERSKAKKIYLKRFPYAILTNTALWAVKPEHVKMTDNRLGFGKKLFWP
ncbi:MAG: hypothetical protein C0592_09875 [Marinilabiliales bacterium]|nr:MAG: hypothetical protein C0592_09875 [Marinilabiliales bacterium]